MELKRRDWRLNRREIEKSELKRREMEKSELKRCQMEKSELKRRDGFNGFEVSVTGGSLGRCRRARSASVSAVLRECKAQLERVLD